jgi:hypothetical protein
MEANQITEFSVMNIQINHTRQSCEALTQVTQPMPPKSRYSNKDFDAIHPQWISYKTNQIIDFNAEGKKDKS